MSTLRKQIWGTTKEGFIMPTGYVDENTTRRTTTFRETKSRAEQIEQLYRSVGLTISPASGFYKIIEKAKALDHPANNTPNEVSFIDIFYSLALDRIAAAIIPLTHCSEKKIYLGKLISGELDPFVRKASHAKDIFWEIEFWSLLRKNHSSALLKDPPDILVPFRQGTLGVSCKKIYSERNVEKTLSIAVSQVESDFDVGVVALNIDDLTPPDSILRVRDETQMHNILRQHTDGFLARHERYFRKYLSSGRLVSAIVCVNVIADIVDARVQFNNARSSVAWTIPGLSEEKQLLLSEFHKLVVP